MLGSSSLPYASGRLNKPQIATKQGRKNDANYQNDKQEGRNMHRMQVCNCAGSIDLLVAREWRAARRLPEYEVCGIAMQLVRWCRRFVEQSAMPAMRRNG